MKQNEFPLSLTVLTARLLKKPLELWNLTPLAHASSFLSMPGPDMLSLVSGSARTSVFFNDHTDFATFEECNAEE